MLLANAPATFRLCGFDSLEGSGLGSGVAFELAASVRVGTESALRLGFTTFFMFLVVDISWIRNRYCTQKKPIYNLTSLTFEEKVLFCLADDLARWTAAQESQVREETG